MSAELLPMSKLVHGPALTFAQRSEVLACYILRPTVENAQRNHGGKCPMCEAVKPFPYVCGEDLPGGPISHTREKWHAYHIPLTTDAQWLADHAFYITKSGHLDSRKGYCEPAYMAGAVEGAQ